MIMMSNGGREFNQSYFDSYENENMLIKFE